MYRRGPAASGPRARCDAARFGLCWWQDPGNLGTVLRSAAAFGWPQVVVVGGCDPGIHVSCKRVLAYCR